MKNKGKKKVYKKKEKAYVKPEVNKIPRSEIFYSLIGYFVGVFCVNILSGGVSPNLLFNPVQAIEFFNTQIFIVTGLSRIFTLPLGFLLTLVFPAFVYVLLRDLKK